MSEGIGLLVRPWVKKYVAGIALNGVPVNYPKIDPSTHHWLIFDPTSGTYFDSGVLAQGTDGIDGVNGIDGVDGSDGTNGKSAYDIWLDAGNTGSEADFLNSLIGSGGGQQTALPWCAGYMKDRSLVGTVTTELEPIVEKGDSSLVSGTNFVAPIKGLYLLSMYRGGVMNISVTNHDRWLVTAPVVQGVTSFYASYTAYVSPPHNGLFYAEAGERFAYTMRTSAAVSTIASGGSSPLFTFACIAAL